MVVDHLWQLLSMHATTAATATSADTLRDCMRELQRGINLLADSIRSHCAHLASLNRADAEPHSGYYLRLWTGRFVYQLLRRMLDLEVFGGSACERSDVESLMSPSQRMHPSSGRSVSSDDFRCWQRTLAWWQHWEDNPGPRHHAAHDYFHYLKQTGWLHMKHWAPHCTCERDFASVYQTVVRLAGTLRAAPFQHDLHFPAQIVGARHATSNRRLKTASDCVLPSLKIREDGEPWKTVFDGCGVLPDPPIASAGRERWV